MRRLLALLLAFCIGFQNGAPRTPKTSMPITFSTYTVAYQFGIATIIPSYPTNASGQLMLAFVNVYNLDDSAIPTVTAPAGWTLVQDNGAFGSGVYRAVWYKLGDGSTGSMTWTFDKNVRGEVAIGVWNEVNTSSPIDTSSFKNESSLTATHTTTAITTAQANELVIACYFSADTSISFTDGSGMNTRISLSGVSGGAERPMLITDTVQAAAGTTGSKTATSNSSSFTQMIMVAVKAAPNPSTPQLTYPNGGESLTAGATVNITWNPSTSPTAAQSSLKYNLEYSSNNGASWTSIVSLTSAGVTSYAWTVPSSPISGGYLIRIRANDPGASLYSLAYDQSDAPFSVVSETAPPAPTVTAPTSGGVYDKSTAATPVSWTYGGGAGNPQTKYTIQWSRDNFASHTATIGPITSAAASTTIDFSAEASGATISLKVKTTGLTLDSAYSAVRQFLVASPPAAPNITAPTNASPPTTAFPGVTFTESDSFVSRKFRVVRNSDSVEVYNTGEVSSNALSFTSPYTFQNGVAVTIYLSVKNSYGLWSSEDSESVTPSFTVPATPTISVTAVSAGGYNLIQVTNSDTPSYNEIWAYREDRDSSTAICIGASLPKNVAFQDFNRASGERWRYFARAYNSNGYAQSATASAVALSLTSLFVHAVSRTGTASNANGNVAILTNPPTNTYEQARRQSGMKLLGRTAPSVARSQFRQQKLTEGPIVARAGKAQLDNLTTIKDLAASSRSTIVCVRDQAGNRLFGKLTQCEIAERRQHFEVRLEVTEARYTETLSGSDPAYSVPVWTPLAVSGCVGWFAADKISGIADAGAVTTWSDASGAGNDATQGTSGKRPLYYSDYQNGLPVVYFDGTDDTLVTAAGLWSGSQARALFAVFKPASASVAKQIAGQSTSSTALTTFELAEFTTAGNDPCGLFPGNTLGDPALPSNNTEWKCGGLTYDGATAYLYRNGVLLNSAALALNTTSAGFRLGSKLAGGVESRFWNGPIAEVIAYSSLPSASEIAAIFQYLNAKWGLY